MVAAAELGDPGRLEGLVRRVFGDGDRPAGWFHRKLRRERVDLRLSPVAVRAGADPQDPAAWLGYVLVGTPPSRGDAVRTAGTGVRAEARGHGVGGLLVAGAAELAAAAGHRRMELMAEAAVVPFYLRHGFVPVLETLTALAFARGSEGALGPPPPWRALAPGEREVVAWLPEAWEGTELAARHGLAWTSTAGGPATVWLSREGIAWLVQRLVAPADRPLPALAAMLQERLPAGAPVVLPLLPARAPATLALLDAGFVAVQRGVLLERPLALYSRAVAVP
jgi:GNAT superfamily N-acetyltransferase